MLVNAGLSDPSESIQRMTKSLFTENPDGSLYDPTTFAGGRLISVQKTRDGEFTLAFSSYWEGAIPDGPGYSSYINVPRTILLRVNPQSGVAIPAPSVIENKNFSSMDSSFEVLEKTLVSGTQDSQFHYLAYRCSASDGKKYVMVVAYLSTGLGTYLNSSRFLPVEGLKGELVDCTLRDDHLVFTFSDGVGLQFARISRESFFASNDALIRPKYVWGSTGWSHDTEPMSLSGVGAHTSVSSFEYRDRLVMLVSGQESTKVFTFDEKTSTLKEKSTLPIVGGRPHPSLVSQSSNIPVSYPDTKLDSPPYRLFTKWTSISYDSISS